MSNLFANIPKLQAPERRGAGGDEDIAKRSNRESVSDSEDLEQDARRSPVPKAKATTIRERNTDPFVDYEESPPQPRYAEAALQTLQSAVREVDLPNNPEDALKRLDELRLKEEAGWLSSQPFREKNEYLRSKLNEFQKLREVQKEVSDFSELERRLCELQKQDAERQKQVSELQQQISDLQKRLVQQKPTSELQKQLDEANETCEALAECLKRTRNQRDRLNVKDDEHFQEAQRLARLCRDNGINPYPRQP